MNNPTQLPLDEGSFFSSLLAQQAYWLTANRVGWPLPPDPTQLHDCSFQLHVGPFRMEDGELHSAQSFTLGSGELLKDHPELAPKLPYLWWLTCYENTALAKEASLLMDKQLAFTVHRADGRVIYSTGVQLWPVLDEIAFYKGNDLGVSFSKSGTKESCPILKLWAPTARTVRLHVYPNREKTTPIVSIDMTKEEYGVWSATGEPSWNYLFYLYEIDVYVPQQGQFRRFLTTDPYSISLSSNSARSQILDLNDQSVKPQGWDTLRVTGPAAWNDIVLYELHVRDFSAHDPQVKEEFKGTFAAFSQLDSLGMRHIANLAKAGLTHIHLLPSFDFATVNDNKEERKDAVISRDLPPDSPLPAKLLDEVKDRDSFNWGYDPLHYLAPEGSYSTDPDGSARVREFREMVAGLNKIGLNVVMDVVFNHTYRINDFTPTVFDRCVPGYYYRTDPNGALVSTAVGRCGDVATERRMVEKLMVDAIALWAKQYKVDGFRFDLMGFHTKENLRAVRAALDELTLERDGIDGKKIYLYGEGWKFGSLDGMMPTETCTQENLYGHGIGTFNDRIRDCVRGGGHSADNKTEQGFATGLWYDDNAVFDGEQRRNLLLHYGDVIKVSLAGNLRDFSFTDYAGHLIKGEELKFKGMPAGYAAEPWETINFVSAHDNYDLWDQVAAKAPFQKPERKPNTATPNERARMHCMALSIIALGQGIPFFHAGSDFLRSKSGDNNSYNSGDWFNRIDFSFKDNNWGVGLPPGENTREWDFWAPRLRDPYLKPSPTDIRETAEYFQALLKVRSSSPLFRLPNRNEIMRRLTFLETALGAQQPPGVIAMFIKDDFDNETPIDKTHRSVLAAFNVTFQPQEVTHELLKNRLMRPHSDLTDTAEPRVRHAKFRPDTGTITIPPQTLIVWVEPRLSLRKTGQPRT